MNKFIKKELDKLGIIYDDTTLQLNIPANSLKRTANTKYTQISLPDYIIHEPQGFTLSYDWNHGTTPPEKRMKVKFLNKRGKMVEIDGFGYITNVPWHGWLPEKCITEVNE